MTGEETGEDRGPGPEGGDGGGAGDDGGNRDRFAEAARDERPDLALMCLLLGVEAARAKTVTHRAKDERARRRRDERDEHGTGHRDYHKGPEKDQAKDGDGNEGKAQEDKDRGAGAAPHSHGHGHGHGDERSLLEAEIELDRLAGLLPYSPSRTPEEWARALGRLLGSEHGFHGTPQDYRRLESSLLQSVLRRRRGLPILLSVVWIEVARRAGAPVYGVGLPGHFVIGFGDPAGEHVLADPYNGGRLLSSGDLELLAAGATGVRRPLSASSLHPAGPVEIVLRILNNIRAWAATRPEQSGVQLLALDLSLLLPHRPARLRYERARLLVERGEFLDGAAALEEYASTIEAMEPSEAESVRSAARVARARLN